MGGACASRLAAQATFLYGGQCQRCGLPRPLETHWMKADHQGGTDTLDNLVVLCGPCHGRSHAQSSPDGDLLLVWARNRTALIQIGYLKCDKARDRLEKDHAADTALLAWCSRTFARDKHFHSFHIPDARLLEDLVFLRKTLGRPIRLCDVARQGHFALSTFENRFYRFSDLLQAINDEVAARTPS